MDEMKKEYMDNTCTEYYTDGMGCTEPEVYEGKTWSKEEIREFMDSQPYTPVLEPATQPSWDSGCNAMKKWMSLTEQFEDMEHPELSNKTAHEDILKIVRDRFGHRWNFALDWYNNKLTINNAATKITKGSVDSVYRSMLTLASEDKAKRLVADMLVDKLHVLFD